MNRQPRNKSRALRKNMDLGTVCSNCGKECGRDIEYHHIVPLEYGGQDVISNIVPLCIECHNMCTHGFVHKKADHTGRNRRMYDAIYIDSVFTKYVQREISEKQARKMLGTGCHIREMAHFKDWARINGIDIGQTYGKSGRWHKDPDSKGWHIEK